MNKHYKNNCFSDKIGDFRLIPQHIFSTLMSSIIILFTRSEFCYCHLKIIFFVPQNWQNTHLDGSSFFLHTTSVYKLPSWPRPLCSQHVRIFPPGKTASCGVGPSHVGRSLEEGGCLRLPKGKVGSVRRPLPAAGQLPPEGRGLECGQ